MLQGLDPVIKHPQFYLRASLTPTLQNIRGVPTFILQFSAPQITCNYIHPYGIINP